MSRVASLLTRLASAATAVFAGLTIACTDVARADPCVEQCRGQHNACRMATKLLSSPRCDAQLQACISQCFVGGRMNRGARDRRDMRGRH
jgi:hypothetical protein